MSSPNPVSSRNVSRSLGNTREMGEAFLAMTLAEKMEAVEEALRKADGKERQAAILTGVYTGGGEKVWVFYTRTVRVFGERLNEALLLSSYCPSLFIPRWIRIGKNIRICMR